MRYSPLQIDTFQHILETISLPGKINIIHYYFVFIFPVERQRRLLYLFYRCPHGDSAVIHEILKIMNVPSAQGLEAYLESIQDTRTEEEAQDLMAKVSAYLAESERCRLCSKIFGLE
jgi:hypothetical protein